MGIDVKAELLDVGVEVDEVDEVEDVEGVDIDDEVPDAAALATLYPFAPA